MSEETTNTDAPPPYPGPPLAAEQTNPPAGQPYPPAGQPYPPAAQGYPPATQGYPSAGPPPPGKDYPAGQWYPPKQQGYQAVPQNSGYQQGVVVVSGQPQPVTAVVVGGNCPNCRIGTLVEVFTCCGILLAVLFFPIGILCCVLMREKVCTQCHMIGTLVEEFTCCGLMMAIFFFPIGILCCLMMRQRVCTQCHLAY